MGMSRAGNWNINRTDVPGVGSLPLHPFPEISWTINPPIYHLTIQSILPFYIYLQCPPTPVAPQAPRLRGTPRTKSTSHTPAVAATTAVAVKAPSLTAAVIRTNGSSAGSVSATPSATASTACVTSAKRAERFCLVSIRDCCIGTFDTIVSPSLY